MKTFYCNNLFPKGYFSPGVPHHGECPLQQPYSSGFKTVVIQPTHQQVLWTPLKYIPNAANSHLPHQPSQKSLPCRAKVSL